jgi:hypothetical protein
MGKRGFERIERLWDEKEALDPQAGTVSFLSLGQT